MKPINSTTSKAVFEWQPAAWLRVHGSDAAAFLQGQFTNELRGLSPGRAVYGLWLSVKGKVIADSFVLRGESADEFWVGSYFSPADVVRERMESFIIADDVVVEDRTAEWRAFSVWAESGAALEASGGFVFAGRRGKEPNIECIVPEQLAAEMARRFAEATRLSAEEIARRRIEAGIPAVPLDVGPADLPNEAGLERDAISFTKGCYLGQEVMARLKSMGQVRRRLVRVRGAGEIPARPATLFLGERPIGELRSAAGDDGHFVGLAMISLLNLGSARELALRAGGTPNVTLVDACHE